ncbi:MAG: SMC-Scp complex subunit ScpB, partial [Trichodesmium sp. St16_bin2-tuft]|nr:SMC-Scp complex subunit ScpB [Trichodesmium sp. St16_bin2-tuft]
MYSLSSKIEAILYLKGKSLSISEIAEIAKCEHGQIKDALIELMSEYAHRHTALEVVETEKGYSLQLKPTFTELIESLIQPELGV